MAQKDDEFLKKLLATFRVEADEHLKAMSSGLLELEKAPDGTRRAELVEAIFREAHSLKGAARAVNFMEIESVCQSLESAFAGMKGGTGASGQIFDLLQQALDALGGLLSPEPAAAGKPALATLLRRLDDATPPWRFPRPRPVTRRPKRSGFLPRSSTRRCARRRRYSGRAWRPASAPASCTNSARRSPPEERNARGASERRSLAKLIEQLEAGNLFVKALEDRLSRLATAAEGDHRALKAMVDNLLDAVKEMQLLPLASLLESLPRMVRELARDRGKQADLSVRGGEIEIDRRILEELKDPLIHLLRNCVDHGIETPAQRVQKGKPAHGTISITIAQKDGGKIELAVADDGAGIDVAKV
jgi:two-component system chemotaxis sensor kinase CheA